MIEEKISIKLETKKSKQHVENFLLKINNIKAIVVNIVFVAINWYETEKNPKQRKNEENKRRKKRKSNERKRKISEPNTF